MRAQDLQKLIKNYPDFPQPGVVFRDISPILADPEAFKAAIDAMVEQAEKLEFDKIAAIDARGFLFGGAMAYRLKKGLVIFRKPAKLPGELLTETYDYEYSTGSLSIQKGVISKGDKVLIVDDVLATGNTFLAAHNLVTKLGGDVVAHSCFVELTYLHGRQLLEKETRATSINSIIRLKS